MHALRHCIWESPDSVSSIYRSQKINLTADRHGCSMDISYQVPHIIQSTKREIEKGHWELRDKFNLAYFTQNQQQKRWYTHKLPYKGNGTITWLIRAYSSHSTSSSILRIFFQQSTTDKWCGWNRKVTAKGIRHVNSSKLWRSSSLVYMRMIEKTTTFCSSHGHPSDTLVAIDDL